MAKKLLSDKFMKSKEGDYFDEKDYNQMADYDCDCYYGVKQVKNYYLSSEKMYFQKN